MIRHNKENKDLLTLRRKRMKDLQGKMYRKGALQNPNIAVKKLEEIKRATRGKEKTEAQYCFRSILISLAVLVVLALLL